MMVGRWWRVRSYFVVVVVVGVVVATRPGVFKWAHTDTNRQIALVRRAGSERRRAHPPVLFFMIFWR